MLFLVWLDNSEPYLFHLIDLFLIVRIILLLFSVNKVTIGTNKFVSIILNVAFIGALIPSTGLSPATASVYALLVNTQFFRPS